MRRLLAIALSWIALGLCVLVSVPAATAAPIATQTAATINPNIGAVIVRPITPICQVLGNCTTTTISCGDFCFNDGPARSQTTTTISVAVDPCFVPSAVRRICPATTTTTGAPPVVTTTTTTKAGQPPPPPPGVTTTIKPETVTTITIFFPKVDSTTIPPAPTTTLVLVSDNVRIETSGASFGGIGVSAGSGVKTITVSNLGTIPVRVAGASVPAPFAVVAGGGTCPTTPQLNPNANCTYQVVFRPTAPGQSIQAVSVTIQAPAGDLIAKAGVDGIGTAARIDFDAPVLDMGQGLVGEATRRRSPSKPCCLVSRRRRRRSSSMPNLASG
jgi:hypothetical protein